MKPVYQLTRSSMIWLGCSIILVIAPFITVLPWWLFALALLTLGWRIMVHRGRWSFPHWSVRGALLLLIIAGLILELKGGNSIQLTVALLVASFLLKLMEMYQRRDALVILYVAMLLIACSFIFHQGIPMSLYGLLTLIVVTACLNTVYRGQQNRDIWRPLKRSAVLYMQALPMMLILFLIFPRIGPLWQVDLDTGQAFSGLSDSMAPGDVSQLTRSGEIAFRVNLTPPLPPENQRYWRGVTYETFDGRRWFRSDPELLTPFVDQIEGGQRYEYQVIMEPTGQNWRYALSVPVQTAPGTVLFSDLTLQTDQPQLQRQQYRIVSRTGTVYQSLSPDYRRRLLTLPDDVGMEAIKLAKQWQRESGSVTAFVGRMQQNFAQNFRYTLQPPRLTGDTIDQFLFQTRQGFCGHFAGAGVFLLRAAGIPARVVGGYQGGELNPLDNMLTVRQYEAHAWLEYWDNGRWYRLDPTAVVAPERLDQPADQLFSSQQGFLADATLLRNGWLNGSVLRQLRYRYEALNYSWHRWVLNFHNQQSGLLQSWLGDLSLLKMITLLLVPGLLVLGGVAANLLMRHRPEKDPLLIALARLDQLLEPRNQQRLTGETITQFCQRLAGVYPEANDELEALARSFEQYCYVGDDTMQVHQQLLAQLERCRHKLSSLA